MPGKSKFLPVLQTTLAQYMPGQRNQSPGSFTDGRQVDVVSRWGELGTVPIENLREAIESGQYRQATPEDIERYQKTKEHDTLTSTLAAGGAGFARSVLPVISDEALMLAGVSPKYLQELREYNPTASMVGEAAGMGAALFAGGSSLAAKTLGRAAILPATSARLTTAASRALGGGLFGGAVAGGLEAAGWSSLYAINDARLRQQEISGEKVFQAMAEGGLTGAVLGGIGGFLGDKATKALDRAGRNPAINQWADAAGFMTSAESGKVRKFVSPDGPDGPGYLNLKHAEDWAKVDSLKFSTGEFVDKIDDTFSQFSKKQKEVAELAFKEVDDFKWGSSVQDAERRHKASVALYDEIHESLSNPGNGIPNVLDDTANKILSDARGLLSPPSKLTLDGAAKASKNAFRAVGKIREAVAHIRNTGGEGVATALRAVDDRIMEMVRDPSVWPVGVTSKFKQDRTAFEQMFIKVGEDGVRRVDRDRWNKYISATQSAQNPGPGTGIQNPASESSDAIASFLAKAEELGLDVGDIKKGLAEAELKSTSFADLQRLDYLEKKNTTGMSVLAGVTGGFAGIAGGLASGDPLIGLALGTGVSGAIRGFSTPFTTATLWNKFVTTRTNLASKLVNRIATKEFKAPVGHSKVPFGQAVGRLSGAMFSDEKTSVEELRASIGQEEEIKQQMIQATNNDPSMSASVEGAMETFVRAREHILGLSTSTSRGMAPSETEKIRIKYAIVGVKNPEMAAQMLVDNKPGAFYAMKAVEKVHPQNFEALRAMILTKMSEIEMSGRDLPYNDKVRISIALGTTSAGGMTTKYTTSMKMHYDGQKKEAEDRRPRNTHTSSMIESEAKSLFTKSQKMGL